MTRLLIPLFPLICFFCACSGPQQATKTEKQPLPSTTYLVDMNNDGVFETVELDQVPEPRQGKQQWTIDFYTAIRYPANARERGIQGIVELEVGLSAEGIVKNVKVSKPLHPELDQEAISAYTNSTQQGYIPAIYNGETVNCKIIVPVGFWLE